ncbi:class I mannose-6-phosphate isomerase [Halobacteriovorax sp. HLS]|uniref:class I mannose-6-phosphate isomerase n=1 Tax=Halobacteriovorax sp. HLS TaxID=2234000 RepID=UPI000FDA0510|nr:class I mannose-6-phosphate isomerase [Halobacteriovorax sp. HLS]
MKSIIPLKPFASRKIWGGNLLQELKGLESLDGQLPIGETWEVSAHPDGPSSSKIGSLDKISSLTEIPYLLKLIETSDNLSVQVHPNDAYAKKHEQQKGKSECWLILDSQKNCGIFLGIKSSVTKEAFEKALKEGDDLSELMNFYPTKKGDFFYVPAGTAHAIGKGVFLAEVQQCSDVTYRVWDWNRVDKDGKSRELHIDKALEVIRFDEEFNYPVNFKIQNNIFQHEKIKLLDIEDFSLFSYKLSGEVELKLDDKFGSIFVLSGEIEVEKDSEAHSCNEYEAILLPLTGSKKIKVRGSGNFLFVR